MIIVVPGRALVEKGPSSKPQLPIAPQPASLRALLDLLEQGGSPVDRSVRAGLEGEPSTSEPKLEDVLPPELLEHMPTTARTKPGEVPEGSPLQLFLSSGQPPTVPPRPAAGSNAPPPRRETEPGKPAESPP